MEKAVSNSPLKLSQSYTNKPSFFVNALETQEQLRYAPRTQEEPKNINTLPRTARIKAGPRL